MIREAVAAGRYYPADRYELKKQIESMVDKKAHPKKALGVVSPHAGYPFSGEIACKVFSKVNITDTVIILGPNHTGLGKPFALYAQGYWQTPLGNVPIDKEFSSALLKASGLIEKDAAAHLAEHSIEVQLPIIQYFKPDIKIVPITVGTEDIKRSLDVARDISDTIKKSGKEVLIVASSDMTHYEPQQDAEKKDKAALEAILNLDEKLLFERVREYGITMCGYIPAVIMLSAVKALGARTGELLKYQTSGDVTGGYEQVVGYAGVIVK